jgi:hypothetical protein
MVSLVTTHPLWPIPTTPATEALLRVHPAPCDYGKRIPPLIFARFLFGCDADTKPYMSCASRRTTDHLNRETAEEAWSQPE